MDNLDNLEIMNILVADLESMLKRARRMQEIAQPGEVTPQEETEMRRCANYLGWKSRIIAEGAREIANR